METTPPAPAARTCDVDATAAMLHRLLDHADATITVEPHGGVGTSNGRGIALAVPGLSVRQTDPARPCVRASVTIVRTDLVDGSPVARLRVDLVVPASPTRALRCAHVLVPVTACVAQAPLVDRSTHPTNAAVAAMPADRTALHASQLVVGPLHAATINADGRAIAHADDVRAALATAGTHRRGAWLVVLDRPGAAALPPIAWLTTPDQHVLVTCPDGSMRWLTVLDPASVDRIHAAGLDPFDLPGVHRPFELAG